MALENAYTVPPHSLPTPADSPVENAAIGITRRASRPGSITRYSNRSSIHFSRDSQTFLSRPSIDQENAFSEKRASIDSRKFTADLDNSLLQQIHALRSELENKNNTIDTLEASLHESKAENTRLAEELNVQSTGSKRVKRQMQLLENEFVSAGNDLAKERDNAVASMNDARRRLEDSNKKVRAQDEDAERVQATREQEQQQWLDEKRSLERKVHVLENRLRTMVAEMIAAEAGAPRRPSTSHSDYDDMHWAAAKGDTASIRSGSRAESRTSNRSFYEPRDSRDFQGRASSRLTALHEVGESASSLSLAAELEGEDAEPEEEEEFEESALTSPAALPEELRHRRNKYSEDQKARKIMGLPIEISCSLDLGSVRATAETGMVVRASAYVDAITQTSPPPSPIPHMQVYSTGGSAQMHHGDLSGTIPGGFLLHSEATVIELADRRGDGNAESFAITGKTRALKRPDEVQLRDSSVQASNDLAPTDAETTTPKSTVYASSSNLFGGPIFGLDSPRIVPTIEIHPPGSRPSSSRTSVMLPPRTKNAATIADIELPRSTRSASTQTTESQSRLITLPPRHSSSRIHERRMHSAKANPNASRRKLKSPPPILNNDPPPATPPVSTIRNMYPGRNDDGPLTDKHQFGPRRPIRSGSILAGFSEDDNGDNDQEILSEDEFAMAPPVRKTLSKVKDSWRLVPRHHQTELDRIESMSDTEAQAEAGSSKVASNATNRESWDNPTSPKEILPNTSKKIVSKQNIRKSALASRGPTVQDQRQRSPSVPSVSTCSTSQAPPIPVPTRSSSRKLPLSASDGAASPTPNTTSFFTTRRQQPSKRPISKRKILRKTQSAAAVTDPTEPPDIMPPLPMNADLNPPRTPTPSDKGGNHLGKAVGAEDSSKGQSFESASLKSPAAPTSVESQGSDVIQAVTQTMVGEWMFKYVRKRRSFGITENAQDEFDKGSVGATRHKRWVWVLPRERAVVWSEKEPTTTLAISGKGARKLTIQSVVDVPDATPLPKGYNPGQIFDRSILILTPARALKLTAISRDRHYIWLTSLSYISSSDFNLTLLENPMSPTRTPTRASSYARNQQERPSEDAAEAPQVPRVASHSRKRSSTGPKPVPLSAFHSYSANAVATASSFDLHPLAPLTARDRYEKSASGSATAVTTMTRSTTEPRLVPNDAFDAIGTVRMEAFVEEEMPVLPGRKREEIRGRRKDLMAYWGAPMDDPFRGF